ncbi:hypothetical protein D9Q98_002637 [Chlorella vulgaris]|uniref:Glutamyl-tRNA(Gln) amidotransferase subunit A, chloroplastic/mitochondrial n=1 Tax=Chlorella vulgaris TaxID=3077 RepID=A0A9D4TU51_CHLVU|nr:hypothetical protein D9Q98_002637 [Chlorella vulgaris]
MNPPHTLQSYTEMRVLRTTNIRAKPADMRLSLVCGSLHGPLHAARDQVARRGTSATELTTAYLRQLHSAETQLQCFLAVDDEYALRQAALIDSRLAQGEDVGPLAGVPIAVKDNLCTQGLQTTAGSRGLHGFVPTYDATAVARLRAAGAVVLGKTNMDEFGMGSSCENSGYQPTFNPWDTKHVPGGSSGGSAAAVAAKQCIAALGSDTGGSIRQPASFCGVVGVKPTYGRVSRNGLVAYASSLDCVGPIAQSVADAAAVLTVIAGSDLADATCSQKPVEDYTAGLLPLDNLSSKPLAFKRLALIQEACGEGVDAGVTAALAGAVRHLQELGAEVEQVSLPSFAAGLPAYYVIALSEASSNLSRYDGVRFGQRGAANELKNMYASSRHSGLGSEVARRILMGTYALSAGYYDAYYKRAQQVRTLVRREMNMALGRFDALLCPAAPTTAYRVGEKLCDPLSMYKGDLMTVNLNLAGLPAVCLPCGFSGQAAGNALPVGMQLIGRAFGEADLLKLAHIYEQTSGVVTILPSVFIESASAKHD